MEQQQQQRKNASVIHLEWEHCSLNTMFKYQDFRFEVCLSAFSTGDIDCLTEVDQTIN